MKKLSALTLSLLLSLGSFAAMADDDERRGSSAILPLRLSTKMAMVLSINKRHETAVSVMNGLKKWITMVMAVCPSLNIRGKVVTIRTPAIPGSKPLVF